MRLGLSLSLALLAMVNPVAAQRNCVKGKPCGNTCIAQNRVCRIESSPATPPPAAAPTPNTARGLLGAPSAAGGAMASPVGTVSYCTTGLESVRDLLLVGDVRPSGTIGRDLTDGTPFYAPGSRDTMIAQLLSIHCPAPDQIRLYILQDRRRIMLDARAIPVRSATGEAGFSGNIRVRSAGAVRQAYVWLDAIGIATLRADQGP